MKKIVLFAAALFACVSMSAQLKGDMSISGNLMFNAGNEVGTVKYGTQTETVKKPNPITFGVGVSYGYFVAENCELSLGVDFDFKREWTNWEDSEASKLYDYTNAFSLTPGFKYYVSIVDDLFYYTPNVYMGLGFNFGKTQTSSTETVKKEDLPFVFGLGVDLVAFEIKPSFNIGITFTLGGLYYTNETVKYEEGSGDSLIKFKYTKNDFKFGFESFLTPKIGVKYYFF